ncbi:MAG TPA: Gfo/Idh/MocA family oxidoreductase [Spirochaetota bacterium]|nr:Gfo/Idh/MocA family oxidoreductase [Spirochaetota bacterium]
MKKQKIRWGIIGPGKIAHAFAADLKLHSGSVLAGAASATPGKAAAFIAQHKQGKAYKDYTQLIQSPEIDVVYIATTHNFHFDNALLALNNGKHVLLEKPVTLNAGQAQTLYQTAARKKLFLMEALWTRFVPAVKKLLQELDQGIIGNVSMVHAHFYNTIAGRPDGRLLNPSLAGGALLDIGIYPLSLACMVLGYEPAAVHSTACMSSTGVDETSGYLLKYSNNAMALLSASMSLPVNIPAVIYGSKGRIEIPFFLCPDHFTVIPAAGKKHTVKTAHRGNGYLHEIEEVAGCLQQGKTGSALRPFEHTLAVMKIMDQIRQQWQLVYPDEKPAP